ncbi:MAG: transposase, partial [Chloroflexota bacterium]
MQKRYSLAFKRAIVAEYEKGASIEELRAKYGIGGSSTIQRWIEQYGRYGLREKLMVIQRPEEQNRVKEMQAKISQLEKI